MATIEVLKKYNYKRYNGFYLPLAVGILLTTGSAAVVGADWNTLRLGIGNGVAFISVMFPPDWMAFSDMLQPAAESMLLAFLSTVFGTVISLFFALTASDNLAGNYVRNISRFLISLERSIPEIIILLILVAGFGLGAFPGVIALSLGCVGMLGKLFADAIEEIDPLVLESLHAIGANKAQVIAFGVLPVVLPVMVTNVIFRFEINIRMSIVLGAVGAGGIGFELSNSFALLEYNRAMSAIIVVLVLVFASERVSDFIRNRIKRHEALH